METRDDIEQILKNKYEDIIRDGNRFYIYFDLTSKQTEERKNELNGIYNYLKSTIQRKVALNPRTYEGSSIGSVDIIEENSVSPRLSEIKIYSKPKRISKSSRPGSKNEDEFYNIIQEIFEINKGSIKLPNLVIKSNIGSGIVIRNITGVQKTNLDNINHKVDFTVTAQGKSVKISLKAETFGFWTGANTLKAEVKKVLDEGLKRGAIISTGSNYGFDPKSSITGIARKATLSEIKNNIFGTTIDSVIISNISSNNANWDIYSKTLTLNVSKCYTVKDINLLLDNVFLYVRKSGTNIFENYRGFDARFASTRQVNSNTSIVSV